MDDLQKYRWFYSKNQLSAGVHRFHAQINILTQKKKDKFQVIITDSNMDQFIISFSTLEEAFTFVHSTVPNCNTLLEISKSCKSTYQNKRPKIKKHEPY